MHENSNGQKVGDLIFPYEESKKEKLNGKENPLKVEFVEPEEDSTDSKDSIKPQKTETVSYYRLFRYATCFEQILVYAGIILSVLSGLGIPLIIILYGELTTLLVDRSLENITSTHTPLLEIFGGGKILVNGSKRERYDAIEDDAAAYGLGSLILGLLQFVIGAIAIALLNYVAQKQIARVRQLFLQAVLRQDISWYDTTNTASFASRLSEDLDKMQNGIGEKLSIFIYLITVFIASIIMSFLKGWKLTLVVLVCAPVIIIAQAIVAKVQSSLAAQEMESYGDAGAVAEEVLSSVRTVVAFGGEDKEVERFKDKLIRATVTGIKRGVFSGLGSGVMWFIIYCSYSIAFWYGVTLILESRENGDFEYTPDILVIVLFGVLSGAFNMGLASPHLEAFAVARGSAAAVFAILDRVPEIDTLNKSGLKPKIQGNIQLEGLHFEYPARSDVKVLKGLSLTVKCGETVALVGSSGCGKSTIIQLVQRLYDPSQGKVLIDDTNIKELNVNWLRSHIGVVGQEPVLFGTTIRENIQFGRMDATQEEIEEAAKEANAHDFISKLPEGYDTMVGERGTQLSGGQKQRIAIARALIRRPNILLLDEATSALDLHSEARVQAALDVAAKGRTTLIVTHRLSTVRNADRIVFISGGQVMEQGTHEELLTLKGHYHALVEADPTLTQGAGGEDVQQLEEDVRNADLPRQMSVLSQAGSTVSGGAIDLSILDKVEEVYEAPLSRLMALNKPEWIHCVVGCIAATVIGASMPAFAILFGEVLGVLGETDPETVQDYANFYSVMFLVIGVVTGLGMFLQMYCFALAGTHLTERLRVAAFSAMLKQEVGWFDEEKNGVGILCARLSGDASSVQGATGIRVGVILQATSTLIVGALIAFILSWKMTLVSLLGIPLVFIGVFLESRVMRGQGLHEKTALELASKIAVEAISNIRTVVSLCAEQTFLQRYMVELDKALVAARRKTRLRGPIYSLGQTAPFFGYALSFYYGGYLIANEELQYKDVIKISEALIFGAWMLGQGLAFAPDYSVAKMAAGRMFRLMDRKPRIYSPSDLSTNNKGTEGRIEYSKIKFQYPTRPEIQVLRGLNLKIQPGKTVALVGPSGCGKSTCIQLLQRFYEPSSGSVTLDEKDICSLPVKHLRAQLGIVSQEPVLFDRTIAENIAYGDNGRTIPMEEIIEAAKKSNIHNFITSLPSGYDTGLGSKGTQLSGGQKQRIAIARALVRNPRILLLDEATSALDTQSEKVVQEALDQAREGRTCITIAHRLATVQQADVICVINKGIVAEMGSHDELLRRQGLYCQLLKQAASRTDQ